MIDSIYDPTTEQMVKINEPTTMLAPGIIRFGGEITPAYSPGTLFFLKGVPLGFIMAVLEDGNLAVSTRGSLSFRDLKITEFNPSDSPDAPIKIVNPTTMEIVGNGWYV